MENMRLNLDENGKIPAFFVNNKKIDGPVTAKKLKAEIEAAL